MLNCFKGNSTPAHFFTVLGKVSELMETDTRRYGTQTDHIRQVHVGTQGEFFFEENVKVAYSVNRNFS